MSESSGSPRPVNRRESLLADERLPWLVLPVLMVGFWIAESWMHVTFFDNRTFLQDLWPDGHELWMRVLVGGCLFLLTFLWSLTVKQRNARIRELSEYQAKLRELTNELAYGDSEERRELSDRLHEEVAQSLSAVRMFLSGVQADTDMGAERLASATGIVEDEIAAVRDLAEEISPPSLDEYGLWAPLESLCRRVMRRTGTSVECGPECDAPLTREVVLATFRTLAEVIETAASEASSGTVSVSGECSDTTLAITVAWLATDEPGFFAPSQLVWAVGGELLVTSAGGSHDAVVTVPLAR